MLRAGAPPVSRRPRRLLRHHYSEERDARTLPAITEEREEDGERVPETGVLHADSMYLAPKAV